MSAQYGKSAAQKHLERGDLDEALEAATSAIDGGSPDAGPWFERAQALDGLGRPAEALVDLEVAVTRERAEPELDAFALDDVYFACAVAAAQAEAKAGPAALETARARLARYLALFPQGSHRTEATEWDERLRGVRTSLLDKTVEIPGT